MKKLTRVLSSFLMASLLAGLVMGMQSIPPARAASTTYIVNHLADLGDGTCDVGSCTLRDAILAANANAGADTITFSVSGTITLGSALPNISDDLIIDGTGNSVFISGNDNFQILVINSGKTVSLNMLTIQDGKSALSGGGIFNNGTLTVKNSTFTGNQAVAAGGSIYNVGTLTVENSTFSGNSADYGGGISNFNTLTISNSTFSGNNATTSGGGTYNEAGVLTIWNSTFSGNSAATTSGGGIYNKTGATLNYTNTIVANSTSGGDCKNDGTVVVNNHNLVRDSSCSAVLTGDPKLEALADNGGPTKTMKLLTGSPALDTGDDICAALPVNNLDQRGVTRPQGPHCDIGAYEAPFVPVVSLTPATRNFGNQQIGTTSAAKVVTLTYTGAGTLSIGTLGISGDFAFSTNNCNGKTLAPAGTCAFRVTFAPISTGPKTGTVSIPSNAPSSPDSVSLTGTGTSPAVGLSLTTLRFNAQFIGTTSATKTVTLTNTGTGNLEIGILRITGDFTLRSNTCTGAILAAASACKFGVAFSPNSTGIKTGAVSIPSNATSSPNRVTLRGTVNDGTQLLKMANFDTLIRPIPWIVDTPNDALVTLRNCAVFLSPSCSAQFTGTRQNPTLSALQVVFHTGAAGDKFYLGMASRASKVPVGGQYSVQVTFWKKTAGTIGSTTLTFASGTHDFQTLGVYYTVPAKYDRIFFNFTFQKTSGTAWFDNAVLIEIP
jgi:CSLREA domain-containing protein